LQWALSHKIKVVGDLLEENMTTNITLELPSELEHELATEASQLKLPLSEYILRVLSFRPFLQTPPKTGVELVAYWESIGVVSTLIYRIVRNTLETCARILKTGSSNK